MTTFRALVLDEKDGKVTGAIKMLADADLPAADVTVAVSHTTLNYKDGLILNGVGRLVRKYPHVPGIDFVGKVTASSSPEYKPGDFVILTGWRVGEAWWGGYAARARVKAEWLVPLPAGLTPARAMAIGTAGFTAMLAIIALEKYGLRPGQGEVLVTGAAGGVGSVAVAVLAELGYDVVASTGRTETHDYLKSLGAKAVIDRAELAAPSNKPLQSERWAGCIDSVGGPTLVNALAQLKYRCSAAACGLAGSSELPGTVLPFILRGVNLLGIDSVMQPRAARDTAWQRLARELPPAKLDAITTTVGLDALLELGGKILKGQVRGRLVVDLAR
jgi:acrylyl-CoA reductase (NADPH)